MKKLFIATAVVCLTASNAFANGAAVTAAEQAAGAAAKAVAPMAPAAGAATGAAVSGSSVVGAGAVKKQATAKKSSLFELQGAAVQDDLLAKAKICKADSVMGKLPGVLANAVGISIEKGAVNSSNTCLPDFDDEVTSSRAAGILSAFNATLGSYTVRTAGVDLLAKAVAASARDLAKRANWTDERALISIKQICRVKGENGMPKECLFNASVCNTKVLDKVVL